MPPLDDNGAPAIGAPEPAPQPAAESAAGPGRPRPGRPPALAGGSEAARRLRPLLDTVLDALSEGAAHRAGPLPAGGPDTVARQVLAAATPVLPDTGSGADEALHTLVTTLAAGAADPADPYCTAHLHGPPLAMAVAADLAAAALNPSLDSWDQAPAASTLEALVTAELARLVYPDHPAPDAVVTTGGTESNHLALLLARERARATGSPGPRILCGANAHHSVHRAAWLLGLPEPHILPTPNGILDPATADQALHSLPRPVLLIATAGTTGTGAIDPLPELARSAAAHRAELHIDAAYAGPLLLSPRRRPLLTGLQAAASVTFDLHKLGWQPIAAGLLAVPRTIDLRPLEHRADYLNAADDTEAGLPDLLGRSLRTTRRPDILKIAVTLRALGRQGLAALVDHVCDQAQHLAHLIDTHPRLVLHSRPTISTVLFRPAGATDEQVATVRRALLTSGTAVLGRSYAPDPTGTPRLWLKITLLNPTTRPHHLATLLRHVTEAADRATTATPTAGSPQEGTPAR